RLLEHLLVPGVRGDRLHGRVARRLPHLDRIQDGQLRLLLQARGPAVEEERLEEERVQRGRRGATAELIADALGHRPLIGEAAAHVVAGRAGDRAVLRETGVEVELPPERHALGRHQVVGRDDLLPQHVVDAGRRRGDVRDGAELVEQRYLFGRRHRAVHPALRRGDTGGKRAEEYDGRDARDRSPWL